ncbi:MAG: hypothetical protein QGD91_07565 [Actinomycetota bacterium]|nr:hypothetical protein [Actinomycetota bacterium]
MERKIAERSTSVEWTVHEATAAAARSIADAEATAAAREHEAFVQADQLRARITSMEQAVSALERAAVTLSEYVQHEAKVIDLTAVEQLDRIGVEDLVTSASEDTGTATTDEPLVSMTDPADNGEGGDEMAPTRYQRSTGVPLRERIKIARMSG